MVIGGFFLLKKLSHTDQNIRHIPVHQLTVICIQDTIGAALLVQAQRKRTILIFITKENSILLR